MHARGFDFEQAVLIIGYFMAFTKLYGIIGIQLQICVRFFSRQSAYDMAVFLTLLILENHSTAVFVPG